jgi:hypothetical protein
MNTTEILLVVIYGMLWVTLITLYWYWLYYSKKAQKANTYNYLVAYSCKEDNVLRLGRSIISTNEPIKNNNDILQIEKSVTENTAYENVCIFSYQLISSEYKKERKNGE